MIGLGASAISNFPDTIIQNEKHPGRYRSLALSQNFTASRGVERSPDDRLRGKLIESLLCTGNSGAIPDHILDTAQSGLTAFIERRLVQIERSGIVIPPDGLPYSRAIASSLDNYRVSSGKQFSVAI